MAAICVLLPLTATAASNQRPQTVIQAENYLASIDEATARFLQTAQDGTQMVGTFYLNRPGKLRFEYDKSDDFVVADGFFIYFYDSELGEQTNAPVGQTLADFLLRDNLKLQDDITVTSIEHGGGLLQITAVQTADPGAGSITLGFKENPMELRKWRITDATGAITEVELFQLKTDVDLDSDLFIYKDPNKSRKRYND